MLPIQVIVAISMVHWVADFIVQNHEDAEEKWKNNGKLSNHVFTYTMSIFMGMILFIALCVGLPLGYKVATPVDIMAIFVLVWAILNGVFHWITDYITSKLVHRLKEAAPYRKTRYKDMMIAVGLDQLIHLLTLFITWYVLPIGQLVKGY